MEWVWAIGSAILVCGVATWLIYEWRRAPVEQYPGQYGIPDDPPSIRIACHDCGLALLERVGATLRCPTCGYSPSDG